jgi:murein DD-endopeptidase MepM/ murein hydrolase activator NlpD
MNNESKNQKPIEQTVVERTSTIHDTYQYVEYPIQVPRIREKLQHKIQGRPSPSLLLASRQGSFNKDSDATVVKRAMLSLLKLLSRRCLSSSLLPFVGFPLLMVRASSLASGSNASLFGGPEHPCSPFGAYPNPLGITDHDRASFHPVIKFPWIWSEQEGEIFTQGIHHEKQGDRPVVSKKKRVRAVSARIADLTKPNGLVYLATDEERVQRRTIRRRVPAWQQRIRILFLAPLVHFLVKVRKDLGPIHYSIGRYDEDRVGLYVSEMFEDIENSIDGYAGARTVHMGMDLGGPVGTKVYSFADGKVHSAGYNPQLGDYGNVVVVEHTVPSNGRKVWALYGHLDDASIQGKSPGQNISKGQVIGRVSKTSVLAYFDWLLSTWLLFGTHYIATAC